MAKKVTVRPCGRTTRRPRRTRPGGRGRPRPTRGPGK